jgi:hypothetical protein
LDCRQPIGMLLASVASRAKLYRRAAETALRHGLRNVAAEFEEADARADALSGNCQTVRRLGRPALALAMCGDAAQAEKLAGRLRSFSQTEPSGMRCSYPRFALRSRSSAISPPKRGTAEHPPRPTSALTPRRCTCGAWLTCVCVRAWRQRLSSRRSWITRAPIGAAAGAPLLGTVLSLSYLGWRAARRSRATRRKPEKPSGLPRILEDADPDIPVLKQAKAEYARLPRATANRLLGHPEVGGPCRDLRS